MIQRHIYRLLKEKIESFQARPEMLTDLFSRVFTTRETEITAIKTKFLAETPQVVNGFSQTRPEPPIILVTLGSEQEVQDFLGDAGGMIVDSDDLYNGAQIEVFLMEHMFNLYIYARHLDQSQYYYELTKAMMVASYREFTQLGMFQFHLSGSELRPDELGLPEQLFVRQLTFKCRSQFTRTILDSLPKGNYIDGLHIDSEGSSGNLEGTETNVGVYTLGEEE